jgi:hypothetical protein
MTCAPRVLSNTTLPSPVTRSENTLLASIAAGGGIQQRGASPTSVQATMQQRQIGSTQDQQRHVYSQQQQPRQQAPAQLQQPVSASPVPRPASSRRQQIPGQGQQHQAPHATPVLPSMPPPPIPNGNPYAVAQQQAHLQQPQPQQPGAQGGTVSQAPLYQQTLRCCVPSCSNTSRSIP